MKLIAACLCIFSVAALFGVRPTTAAVAAGNNNNIAQVGLYAPDRYDGIPEMCLMPMDFGYCRAKVKRYYFDMRRMKCAMFYWGGCAGNINNFKSLDECNKICTDGLYDDNDNGYVDNDDNNNTNKRNYFNTNINNASTKSSNNNNKVSINTNYRNYSNNNNNTNNNTNNNSTNNNSNYKNDNRRFIDGAKTNDKSDHFEDDDNDYNNN